VLGCCCRTMECHLVPTQSQPTPCCRHFIPVCSASCNTTQPSMRPERAAHVRTGDLVLVVAGSAEYPQLSVVLETWETPAAGAFNPYVRGADLIVDGVVSEAGCVPSSYWLGLPGCLACVCDRITAKTGAGRSKARRRHCRLPLHTPTGCWTTSRRLLSASTCRVFMSCCWRLFTACTGLLAPPMPSGWRMG
jgi:hypothetical protein